MTKKNQHFVPHKDGWAVKDTGNEKATAIQTTQQSAIAMLKRGYQMLEKWY